MNIGDIYTQHHAEKGRLGFSILEEVRAKWFLDRLPKNAGSFLDLGCRDGKLTEHFKDKAGRILGVDVDRVALDQARARLPQSEFMEMDLLGDWHEIGDRKFDVILCSEVLEHVYFPERVVSKVAEHLNPGGVFIGSVPNAFFIKHRLRYLFGKRAGTPLEDPTHITQFDAGLLKRILERVGKDVAVQGYTRAPFGGFARRWPGLFAFDLLFAVKK